MDNKKLVELITEMAEPIVKEHGLELVDVEYIREKDWFLRIYINKPGGIDIDDCSVVSSKLTKVLDERDPIKEKYYLEVSSPGIDRPLKKDKDFQNNYGKMVDVQLFAPLDGKKEFVGVLSSHSDMLISLIVEEKEIELERKAVASIRPHIEF
ncbi:MAG: ribosome maturation factor RimP [Acidaminococcaceae bacterium]|nr:ribosome maturation factor RimP [Acidaminococcaceae bacterium]NLU45296.1 ribosome maturation factor RimP [Acholeplasmataceae bacterium]